MGQKHVVFDFDGTIADSSELTFKIFCDILEGFGLERISVDVLGELKNLTFVERMSRLKVPPAKIMELIGESQKEVLKKFRQVRPFGGMREVLVGLKERGLAVGILTSNLKQSVEIFVKENDFDLFDYVHSGSGLLDKEARIKKIMKEKGVDKEEMIYVGDEVRDVEGARKAGVTTVAVSWGYDGRWILEASKPDYLLDKPGEIIGAVDGIFS